MAEFRESEDLQARLLVHAMGGDQRMVDLVTRFADAWDGKGNVALMDAERRALAELAAGVPAINSRASWAQLTGNERLRLLRAGERVIQLARTWAWIAGIGEGPLA